MPRPQPLSNLSSAVPTEHRQLTPRTPRTAGGSRTGRLEEDFAQVQHTEANEADQDDASNIQFAPLLASADRFSENRARERRSSPSAQDTRRHLSSSLIWATVSIAPLAMGIFMGGLLLFMLVLSLTRPESLHRYLGVKTTPSFSQHNANSVYDPSNRSTTLPNEYLKVCAKMHEDYLRHGDYWDATDIHSDMDSDMHYTDESPTVCSKTITYMLDGTVGLTADLALMAQAAALARERNRTFLVDDTYWNRGKWTDHFEDIRKLQPGPQPACTPPLGNELVACPRTTRHWVVTSRTAKFHFGHEFSNHYENAYAHELNRLKPIFMFAWKSFISTIVPTSANRALIKLARGSLSSFLSHGYEHGNDLHFISTHIRRGDGKTLSYSFPDRKVPVQDYISAIKSTQSRLHHSDTLPAVYLATDSLEVHDEFVKAYEGVVYSLFTAADSRLQVLASPGEYYQNRFGELDLRSRITATRGMIVDLAVLSGLWPDEEELVPDAVICALGSNVCRLAPLGMGWESAFGHVDKSGKLDGQGYQWIDVDQRGLIIPVWEAFELF